VTDLERLRLLDPGPPVVGASSSAGSPGFVGKVTSTGANLAVGKFFLATPTTILGAEVDGGAGSLADGTGPIAVYALGPVAPAAGDYLACRRVDHRWVAEKGTGASNPYANNGAALCCPGSPIPPTVFLTAHNPPYVPGSSIDYDDGYRQSATLTYSATAPSFLPSNLARLDPPAYYSGILYEYPNIHSIPDKPYRIPIIYQLKCHQLVAYVYYDPPGTWGGGDQVYFWSPPPVGGNSCDPYLMVAGADGSAFGYSYAGGSMTVSG